MADWRRECFWDQLWSALSLPSGARAISGCAIEPRCKGFGGGVRRGAQGDKEARSTKRTLAGPMSVGYRIVYNPIQKRFVQPQSGSSRKIQFRAAALAARGPQT